MKRSEARKGMMVTSKENPTGSWEITGFIKDDYYKCQVSTVAYNDILGTRGRVNNIPLEILIPEIPELQVIREWIYLADLVTKLEPENEDTIIEVICMRILKIVRPKATDQQRIEFMNKWQLAQSSKRFPEIAKWVVDLLRKPYIGRDST